MKTLKITSLILAALLPMAANAADTIKQGDTLAAQVSVTRDAMQQVITRLRTVQQSQVGSNPDFAAEAQEFNKAVEAGLAQFETKLSEILRKATFYVDRLQAILDSTAYTADQKSALLEDQVRQIRIVFDGFTTEYNDALYGLYTVDTIPYELELQRDENGRGKCAGSNAAKITVKSADLRLNNQTMYAHDFDDRTNMGSCYNSEHLYDEKYKLGKKHFYVLPELRTVFFQDAVKTGCYSQSCVALLSNHRISYLNLVYHDLDKEIEFKVGNYTLRLNPLFKYYEEERGYYYNGPTTRKAKQRKAFPYFKELFGIKAGDSEGLPFEVSEREYQEILAKQKRQITLEELKTALLNPPGSFFGSWDCPAKVAELKEALCQSELRCLNADETGALAKAIDDANVYSKRDRVSCLNAR